MVSDPSQPLPPGKSPEARAEEDRLTLVVIEGPQQGRRFPLAGHDTFLVGRSNKAHCQLSSKDQHFSRIHFMIEFNPPRCRLIDMKSRNGTLVNGQRVQNADLKDGDRIKAGHTVFQVDWPWSREGLLTTDDDSPRGTPGQEIQHPVSEGIPEAFPVVPGYDIIRLLGRGGMGTVYEAQRLSDRTRVAVKAVSPAFAGAPAQVERFLREARILCQLRHKHIVSFLEMGEAAGVLFFAMEFVEGTDAADILDKQGPFSVRTAVRILCQVLSALAHAHEVGYVHRDIKPGNILVAREGDRYSVKVADFGLARIYQSSQLSGLTMQGEIGGTFAFMAPEQATNFREVQPAADQYAAGATLYNLLTDRFLYDFRETGLAMLTQLLTEEPIPIQMRNFDLPNGLAEAVHRATAREPADRFPDVKAFRQALLPFGQ